MSDYQSNLADRLATIHSDCPEETRVQVVDAMLDEASQGAEPFFQTAHNDDEELYFAGFAAGDTDEQWVEEWFVLSHE